MTRTLRVAPVRREFEVPMARDRAFRLFTERMTDWVPPEHSQLNGRTREIVLERAPAGRWYEQTPDGDRHDWGFVRLWEPPERLVLVWQLGRDFRFDPNVETEVDVRFAEVSGGGTRITFEHRGFEAYGDAANAMRETFEKPNAWDHWLEGFQALIV